MKADVKRKWVRALRSRKFKQDTGALKTQTGYCCLGVLCELYKPAKFELLGGDFLFMGATGHLPNEVREKARITEIQEAHLIYLNDGANATFSEIATYIETYL